MNDFHYALSLAEQLYDVTGDTEDLEEIGLIAYNFIGNHNTILKRARLDVDCKTGIAKLPCDVDIIEAVTYCGEDGNLSSATHVNGDQYLRDVENYIEGRKTLEDPYYISGGFVKHYTIIGNLLHVDKGLHHVNILYHSKQLDENNLPYITDKEAIAIAEYIAYTQKYKEAIKTNNQMVLKMATDLKQQWLFHCDAARVPSEISQNDMDRILNAQSSMGKKSFGRSYKPMY